MILYGAEEKETPGGTFLGSREDQGPSVRNLRRRPHALHAEAHRRRCRNPREQCALGRGDPWLHRVPVEFAKLFDEVKKGDHVVIVRDRKPAQLPS